MIPSGLGRPSRSPRSTEARERGQEPRRRHYKYKYTQRRTRRYPDSQLKRSSRMGRDPVTDFPHRRRRESPLTARLCGWVSLLPSGNPTEPPAARVGAVLPASIRS